MKNWKGFEREIAKIFTDAYYPDNDGEFRRIPQSGGWTITAGKKIFPGDLVPFRFSQDGIVIDLSFPFSIECKTRQQVRQFVTGLYSTTEAAYFDWMSQAVEDAEDFKKIPLVVFRLFRTENIVIIRVNDFYKTQEIFGDIHRKYYFLKYYVNENETVSLVFFLLRDFIEWIDFSIYKVKTTTNFIRSLRKK